MGKNNLKENETRSVNLLIRITPAFKKALKKESKESGMSMTDILIRAFREVYNV